MTDSEKTEHIKKVVTAEGVALRKRHPILNHQNAIGAMILFISLVGMIATAVLYINHHSVHDKFHITLILSGFCVLKIDKISLNSSFLQKPIKLRIDI
ncbi:hypothetical protein FEC16_17665 [Acinetobacter baumannii]|nr:hypothetical protein FEC16_17665 [Acinetobacter baumannii]